MKNKYLIIIILIVCMAAKTLCFASGFTSGPPGSLNNPIIDSKLTWNQALIKKSGLTAPEDIIIDQVLLTVLYYSFDNKIHQGQIVIHKDLSADIKMIFTLALKEKFPFASVIPISQFDWDDGKSMKANNTSGFNYRNAAGSKRLSKHAFGRAVDINPFLNPYIKNNFSLPWGSQYDPDKPGTLTSDSPLVKAFLKSGWIWGGNWKTIKDYQHFDHD
ncbi:M15 family metallopeptidase [Desulfobacterales bacterium HSG17]|nr:M15 family metallopeptidase [Desulfobacterales bacterium HSG17]